MKTAFKFLLLLPLFALMACEKSEQPATTTEPTEQVTPAVEAAPQVVEEAADAAESTEMSGEAAAEATEMSDEAVGEGMEQPVEATDEAAPPAQPEA